MSSPPTPTDRPELRCPVVHGRPFDPLESEQVVDPFPWLAKAQAESPVFYLEKYDLWCVTRHEDVLTVLKDTRTYSSASVIRVLLEPEVLERHPEGHPLDNAMVNMDPPAHTRLRRLAQKAFTPRMIDAREPQVRELCNDLIDEFIDDGSCDLVGQFSRKLPIRAVTQIVGAPLEKAADFQRWQEEGARMSTNAPPIDAETHRELSERAVALGGWLADFIEERRSAPQEDLTSGLVNAELDDGTPALSTDEVIGLISNILAAGTGTTANFIPLLVRDLLGAPDQWAAVQADRSLIAKAVEEALRLHNPVRGVRRVVTRDTVLAEVAIPAGAKLYVHYGSPQRDPEVFDRPNEYDLFREDLGKHFAFGRWAHLCLGAPLARLEARVAIECILDRLPNVGVVPGQAERWSRSLLIPGPRVDAGGMGSGVAVSAAAVARPAGTARGVVFSAPHLAEVSEVTVPAPGADEVLVRARCSLISAGTEMSFYRGEVDDGTRRRLFDQGSIDDPGPFPVRFGYQVVGTVEAAPPGCGYAVGDTVFAKGPHQERLIAPLARVRPIPSGMDPRLAVFGNLGSVALNALLDTPVRVGDCVVVSGLGVVGVLIAHLARRTAGRLILIDPFEERRARATSVGADAVVGPEAAVATVAELSEGRFADLAFEVSGASSALQSALEVTGMEGTICVPAYYGTRSVPLTLSPEFHTRCQRIVSSQVASVGFGLQPRWDEARRWDAVMETLRSMEADELISHVVPLADAPAAYEMIDHRPQEALGVVIDYEHP